MFFIIFFMMVSIIKKYNEKVGMRWNIYPITNYSSLRKMELSFVIWIIFGSGYIAFAVAKVFLVVFDKLIEWIISAKKYEIYWRRFQGNTWRLPNFKKKTELVQFLRKCNEKISGIKNELTLRQICRDVSFKKPVRWQWKNELL